MVLYKFVSIFYLNKRKEKISDNVANTIACLLDGYYQLKKNKSYITINTLCKRAGFSRTTFYRLFPNLDSLEALFKEILLYHLDYYSKEYFSFYTKREAQNFVRIYKDVSSMLKYFTIFMNDYDFMKSHKAALKKMFLKEAPCPASYSAHQKILYQYLVECFCSYNSDIVLYYYQNKNERNLDEHLTYAQIISNQLLKIFDKIADKQI